SLGRPVLAQVELGAVADGPADAGARGAEARAVRKHHARLIEAESGGSRRLQRRTLRIEAGRRHAAVFKRGATLAVEQGAAQGIADAGRRRGHPGGLVLQAKESRGHAGQGHLSARAATAMDVGGADVAFEAENPVVGELVVVAELDAADWSEYPRPVGRLRRARERDVGAACGGAEEPTSVETGPVRYPNDWNRRLGGLGRHDGSKRLGRELVANAGVAGPAVDVLAVAIVDAHEAEPAGVDDLPGEAD